MPLQTKTGACNTFNLMDYDRFIKTGRAARRYSSGEMRSEFSTESYSDSHIFLVCQLISSISQQIEIPTVSMGIVLCTHGTEILDSTCICSKDRCGTRLRENISTTASKWSFTTLSSTPMLRSNRTLYRSISLTCFWSHPSCTRSTTPSSVWHRKSRFNRRLY